MNLRLSIFAAPVSLAGLLLLANCGESSNESPAGGAGPGGAATGGAGTSSTGGGGAGTSSTGGGGAGTSSTGGGGTAGVSTGGLGGGGVGGGGAGGQATAGGGAGGTATAGTSGAGGSSVGTAGGPPATFATLKSVIGMSCYGGVCHDLPEHPFKMIMNDQLYMTILNHMTEHCGPALTPGNPGQSAIVKLLKDDCNGTVRMPMGKCYAGDGDENEFCVPTATIAALEQWITNGAPPQ
jgi:hypothetical protein